MNNAERLQVQFPLYSEDLGIDLTTPSGRFKWFLASILFGARIGETIACNAYKAFEEAGIGTPEKIISAGWDELVRILDAGGYVRYDFSTATKLLHIMTNLLKRYGSLEELYNQSIDTADLIRRLQDFKGIGPVTTQIFLREMRSVWNLDVEVSEKAKIVARFLDIDLNEFDGQTLSKVETALVKLYIKYCKKRKCSKCPMEMFCSDSGSFIS